MPEQPQKKGTAEPEQRVTKERDEDADSIPDWQDTEENPEPANTAAGSEWGSTLSIWP